MLRELLGSIVRIVSFSVTRVLDAMLNDSTTGPLAEPLRSSSTPVPLAIGRVNVRVRFVSSAIAIPPLAGVKRVTVNAGGIGDPPSTAMSVTDTTTALSVVFPSPSVALRV